MSKSCNNVFQGALALTIATLTVKILGAVYKIPLSHILGEEGMGYFNAAYTIYSFFFIICSAGVPKAIMILCADAENELEQIKILRIALKLFLTIGIIITVLLLSLSSLLSRAIGSSESHISIVSIAPSIIFASISGVFRGYYSARSKFIHVAVSQIVEGTIKLVFGLIFAVLATKRHMPIYSISACTILGATFGSAFSMIYLIILSKSKIKSNIARQKLILGEEKSIMHSLIKLSLPIAAGAMVMSITNIIDLAMIMNSLQMIGYTKPAATALYGSYTTYAIPIFNTIVSLFTPLTIAFMPKLVESKKSLRTFENIFSRELEVVYTLFVPFVFGISVYAEDILLFLFDDRGARIGSILLVYLLSSLVFLIPLTVLNSALEALCITKAPFISMLVGGLFKIIVGYIMVGSSRFGIYGAPISTIVSYIVSLFVSLIIAKQSSFTPKLFKQAAFPLINSFISIFPIYVIYLKKIQHSYNGYSFLMFGSISAVSYILLNLLEGNLRNISLRKNEYLPKKIPTYKNIKRNLEI